jgi:hypothetical protein
VERRKVVQRGLLTNSGLRVQFSLTPMEQCRDSCYVDDVRGKSGPFEVVILSDDFHVGALRDSRCKQKISRMTADSWSNFGTVGGHAPATQKQKVREANPP